MTVPLPVNKQRIQLLVYGLNWDHVDALRALMMTFQFREEKVDMVWYDPDTELPRREPESLVTTRGRWSSDGNFDNPCIVEIDTTLLPLTVNYLTHFNVVVRLRDPDSIDRANAAFEQVRGYLGVGESRAFIHSPISIQPL